METTSQQVCQRVKRLVDNTCCLYASNAILQCGPEWDKSKTVRENVLSILPFFDEFTVFGETNRLDMFIVEVRDRNYIQDVHSFASLFHRVLFTLFEVDPTSEGYLTDGITTLEWNFTYRKVKFFVSSFAPFYSRDHTRYSHQPESAYIAFQPDHCFSRRGINSKNPDRYLITEKTKANCEKMGYKYDVNLVSNTPKAVRYIHPPVLGQGFIKWWEEKYASVE